MPHQTRLARMLLLCSMLVLAFVPTPAYPQEQPVIREHTFGYSLQGRPITGVQIGTGPRKLVLIGATHGFPEQNTYQLVQAITDHYRANPSLVPTSVRLYIIPLLNPDGLELQTRFNARGVDLNRNMNTNLDGCIENDWQVTVQGARGIVSDTGGAYPDSEVESRVMRDIVLDASAVIFYHSNAGNVFPAFCEHAPSIALAQSYAAAGGYAYSRYWDAYAITGGMHDWAASLGIAAIVPELISPVDPEIDQNLVAVQAILDSAEALLPLPEPQIEQGISVHPLIWRYWKMHGGLARFGAPLAPPERRGALVRQFFTNAVLELRPDQADTPYLVQAAALGRRYTAVAPGAPLPPDAIRFDQTGAYLYGAFATYWEQAGLPLLGYPLVDEYDGLTINRLPRRMQVFERAVVSYNPGTGAIENEPLGWMAWLQERITAPTQAHQIQ